MNYKTTQGNFGRTEMFIILIGMIISGVHIRISKLIKLNTKYAKLSVFQLYPNKVFLHRNIFMATKVVYNIEKICMIDNVCFN